MHKYAKPNMQNQICISKNMHKYALYADICGMHLNMNKGKYAT